MIRKKFLKARASCHALASVTGLAMIFLGSLIFSAGIIAQQSDNLSGLINKGSDALDDWRYQDAEEIAFQVEEMAAREKDPARQAEGYSFLGQYWFDQGDYKRALAELEKSRELNPQPDSKVDKFYDRMEKLSSLFGSPGEESSPHFIMRWTDPRDRVLAKPGLSALEQAYTALGRDFNYFPKGGKILVEIYPRPGDLANAVGLEEDMIKDSGTIAVCKYRRMMLTSPRALAFGYDYLTTFSHELGHFFIYSFSGEAVPIWLHEGLAKYEELSFRGRAGELSPVPKSLLVSAIRNNELITFAQMSPTFAQFKSPKQGQLAFAEVATMVDYLRQKCGSDSWFKIFDLLKQGKSDKEAARAVCGQDFTALWQDWQKWVLAKGWQVIPGAVVLRMEFKEQEGKEEEEEFGKEEGKAWEFVRLGDLLRDRQFYQAGVVEYKKALDLEPYNPKIMNKVGFGQILAKDYQAAISVLKKAAEIYPDQSTTFVNLGRAYLSANDDQNAVSSFETALELNPFNPIPYRNLINLYQKAGNQAQAKEMQARLEIIKKPGR